MGGAGGGRHAGGSAYAGLPAGDVGGWNGQPGEGTQRAQGGGILRVYVVARIAFFRYAA